MRDRITIALLILWPLLMFTPSHAPAQGSSEGVRKITLRVMPQYPSTLRSFNISGTVKADVLVAPNGTVRSIEVKGGHPLLAQSAQNAVRQWKWEPAPHETHEIVELRFNPN
jgi:TonB family protein